MDDLKISHVNPQVVTDIIATLLNEFGKEAPLTVNRRKVHEYLGMDLNFSIPGKVRISVINYIKELLAGLPGDMDGEAPTPASAHLFEISEPWRKCWGKS